MKRIDKIKNLIYECYNEKKEEEFKGLSALEVSTALGIHRNDASSDLNKLYKEGFVNKTSTRPVLYFLKNVKNDFDIQKENSYEKTNSTFNAHDMQVAPLDDYNSSLSSIYQLAKAAVSYPPYGLHTLITGETGVGKNYLAEKMWEYAKKNNLMQKNSDIQFISFNCAEYAANPQLLLSHLFGYVKGAFTGANEGKKGLVEKAHNGILFLDEVHQLPTAGQELLFTLMDKGTFRPLGSTKDIKVNLMIICATTEDPNTTLLRTFTRRIPVVINIPNLSERLPNEKLELITNFLKFEAKRINLPISISSQALHALLNYTPKGNIGELRSIINLCCAKSYLNYLSSINSINKSNNNPCLAINLYDLPQKVYQQSNLNSSENLYQEKTKDLIVSPYNSSKLQNSKFDNKYSVNLYTYIEKKLSVYKSLNLEHEEVERRTAQDVDNYYNNTVQRLANSEDEETKLIDRVLSSQYKKISNEILENASLKLNRAYSKGLQIAFALHIQQFVARFNSGEIIYNPNLEKIYAKNNKEMLFLSQVKDNISKQLNVPIPEDELRFWAMFLTQESSPKWESSQIGLIVVNHGEGAAQHIANFVNELMYTKCVYAFDAPLNKNVSNLFEELCQLICKADHGKGVLLLVDMGSFLNIEEKIIQFTGISCKIIPCVSSILVLEATKNILSSNETLENIYKQTYHDYIKHITNLYKDSLINTYSLPSKEISTVNNNQEKIILTICSTGRGSADAIKKILEKNFRKEDNIKIFSLSINENINKISKQFGNSLKLIIGSFDPKILNIPFININFLFEKNGIEKIKKLLALDSSFNHSSIIDNNKIFKMIESRCSYFVPSLSTEIAMDACKKVLEGIKKTIEPTLHKENYYPSIALHFLCMLERIHTNTTAIFPEWGDLIISQNKTLYHKLKLVLQDACNPLGYEIPESELCYFLQIV